MSDMELYHYGVKGMKWGVRNDPSKAYTKAMRKKTRLETRAEKAKLKGAKLTARSTGVMAMITNKNKFLRGINTYNRMRGADLNLKSVRLERRGMRWVKKMEMVFKDYSIERIPDGAVEAGKSWVYRMAYGPDTYNVTPNSTKRS